MKKLFFIWACLVLCLTQLVANNTNPISKAVEASTPSKEVKSKAKEKLAFIPNRSLNVEVLPQKDLLRINLSGPSAQLDWIIFQPKGEVKSRISTSAKIDEIKIGNLEAGRYVLMIKDAEGRVLYKAFEKR